MNEKLNEALDVLRREIENLETGDKESKERLEKIVEELEKRLEGPEAREHHHTLVENVSDSLTYFEVSHPRITGILNDLMMTLSNMGI